jgi:vacuolar-type H+-ATPase catalytic subunit A/Vma1
LETARFLKDDFLQQNSFTKYDKYCPFYKVRSLFPNVCIFSFTKGDMGMSPERSQCLMGLAGRCFDCL